MPSSIAWIFHKGKRPNKMNGVKRLSLKDLPNGRVLTKPQHSVPGGSLTGWDEDRPLRRQNPVYP